MAYPTQVLIVEDEEQLAENLKTFLGRYALDIRIAPNADVAMEILESLSPDLLILDYDLPGIDGLQAYEKIAGACVKPPPCVLMTGNPVEAIAERARQQGIRQVLCKPFSFAELQHAIDASMREMSNAAIAGERRVDERRGNRPPCDRTKDHRTWTRRAPHEASLTELPASTRRENRTGDYSGQTSGAWFYSI
jgi:DNA-binding response OmpR family regulator